MWNGTAAAHAEERLAENSGGVGREAGRPMDEARKWRLKFRTYEGEVREVEGREGETLLQVAKKGDLPAMEGTCGGNLGVYALRRSRQEAKCRAQGSS